MAKSAATTVAGYLEELPPDRQKIMKAVRAAVKKRLPKGFEEGMDFGMITYYVPKSVLAETYNGHPLMYAAMAAQKYYCVVYLMTANQATPIGKKLAADFAAEGKKLNMGGSCVRFTSLDDISLDAIGNAVAAVPMKKWVEIYEQSRLTTKAGAKKAASKTAAREKAS